jgi:hypothetical protein
MSCQVCGNNQTDRHHIKTRGSGGTDDDFNILYLCRICHIEYHKIGASKFCKKYQNIKTYLEDIGWEFINEFGRERLRRK